MELEEYVVEVRVSALQPMVAAFLVKVRASSEELAKSRAQQIMNQQLALGQRAIVYDGQWDEEGNLFNPEVDRALVVETNSYNEDDIYTTDEGIPFPVDPRQIKLPGVEP